MRHNGIEIPMPQAVPQPVTVAQPMSDAQVIATIAGATGMPPMDAVEYAINIIAETVHRLNQGALQKAIAARKQEEPG